MRILGLAFGVLVAVVVLVWSAGSLVASNGMERIGNETWPAGLGTLASVERRYPPQKTNDAARRMLALAKPLGIVFETRSGGDPDPLRKAIAEYLKAEHARGEAVIGEPPAEVTAFLAAHETEIDALRDHLLTHPIVWDRDIAKGFDGPLPNLLGHFNTVRLLTARALVRGRANDLAAWDDLHAAWRVEQTIAARPELISQLIALAITRMVNSAAWKLPPSAQAAWFEEVRQNDHRKLLLGAYQYEMWVMWRHGEKATMNRAMAIFGTPYMRWAIVDMADRQRAAMQSFATMNVCNFEPRDEEDFPRWNVLAAIAIPGDGAWAREFRSVVEREATTNAMRIAQGQPIVAQSACSGGVWRFENDRLTFNGKLAPPKPPDVPMPLSLAIPARATRQSI
jgi:hypothetical protein